MKRPIVLANDLALPLAVVTESVGILAVKRAGKSHTAKRLVEQLHHASQQVVIVDPKGDWWGVQSSADGKDPGLPIVIIGGEHGDVPLEVGSGELVARMVAVERVSVLLDLSELRKHQVATFMTAFLETLYRLKAKDAYRTPMMLVIDEADAIAPQRPMKGEERMLGAAEDIVRRGGQRGIGITLITQRAAVLNKNVLTQVGVLILLRTTGHQDIKAVNEWIEHHQQERYRIRVMETIAAMPRGTAWVWAPGWPDGAGIFQQVVIAPIETFDSGQTPQPGERRLAPKTVADVDLAAFRREMAATIEKAKAEDPKALRAEIARLAAELKRKPAEAPAPAPKRVEVPVLKDRHVKALERFMVGLDRSIEKLGNVATGIQGSAAALRATVEPLAQAAYRLSQPPPPLASAPRRVLPAPAPVRVAADPGDASVGQGYLRDILVALAQHPEGLTAGQIGLITGRSTRSSTFDTYISRARTRGWLTGGSGGFRITEAGLAAVGSYDPLPTGRALLEHWISQVGPRMKPMLRAAADAYPNTLTKEEVAAAGGLSVTSSTFDTYLSRLRTLKLIEGSGDAIRASEEFFK